MLRGIALVWSPAMMYGDGRPECLVLNGRARLVRGFSCPLRAWSGYLRVGAVDAAAACAPCRRPGGTVRDRGCRNLVPAAPFLEASPRCDGRRASRGAFGS